MDLIVDPYKSFEKCTFIPRQTVKEIQELSDKMMTLNYPDIDKAESLESLGIVESFEGNWAKAIAHLEQSLSFENVKHRRKPRQLATARLLVRFFVFHFDILIALLARNCTISQW